MDLATIVGSRIATSVSINGLIVPANSIGSCLINFCEPGIFIQPESTPFDLVKSGSNSKFTIYGNYFSLLTYHQFKGLVEFDARELAIPTNQSGQFTTSNSLVFSTHKILGEDQYDLRLFDFTKPVDSSSLSRTGWYDLERERHPTNQKPDYLMCYGFPGEINEVDYETPHYRMQGFEVIGERATSDLEHRKAFSPIDKPSINLSGMSGGPVFGVYIDRTGVTISFQGILSEATKSKCHYIPRSVISKYIAWAFPEVSLRH